MKKNVFLIGFLLLFMISCFKDCDNPTSPDPIKPPEPKYFNVQVQYTRPAGSILQPDQVGNKVFINIEGRCNWGYCSWDFFPKMIDDYHSEWSTWEMIPDNEDGSLYCMWGIDEARWDGIHKDTKCVGNIFFIRVKETGFEKQLTNVVPNTVPGNAYGGPNARIVLWRLRKDGTVADS